MTTKNDSGVMSHLENFPIIPFENFNTCNTLYIVTEMNLTFSKGIGRNEIFHHKGREKLAGLQMEFSGWCSPCPRTNHDTGQIVAF